MSIRNGTSWSGLLSSAFLERYPSPADARGLGEANDKSESPPGGSDGAKRRAPFRPSAWCRIVWQCWQDGVPYHPARHRALQQHVTVTIPTSSGPQPDLAATQRMAAAAVTREGGPQDRARSA